jgi:sphinganine-1-phosphate aldolase
MTQYDSALTLAALLQLRVSRDYRLSGEAVARAITRNTVLVVASAPGFPHGVMDHVADIAAVSGW